MGHQTMIIVIVIVVFGMMHVGIVVLSVKTILLQLEIIANMVAMSMGIVHLLPTTMNMGMVTTMNMMMESHLQTMAMDLTIVTLVIIVLDIIESQFYSPKIFFLLL